MVLLPIADLSEHAFFNDNVISRTKLDILLHVAAVDNFFRPDRDGDVTLDACIMDHLGRSGGVMFVKNIMHPISIARLVMEKTPHVYLVGEGAEIFALQGASETIKKFKPKLAIALYHSTSDFDRIPRFINELNLDYKNPKVWNAVNDIAVMIHELDPNHPATTVLAGINKREIDYIKAAGKDIDFLSVNTYGGLATLPKEIINAGWDGPYMVTEWGPTGHWECLQTPWKSAIEETSSEKAAVYKTRYEYGVEKDKATCMGSYVFLWGQKQERTPTWYGLFTEAGEESEVINVIQYLWTGRWPANKAPHIYSLQLNKQKATDNIYLKPGVSLPVAATVTDPENDKLIYRWEILSEPVNLSQGGDHEDSPSPVKNAFTNNRNNGTVTMRAPLKAGAYRVFVYATDGHNNVATANIPFYIKGE